MKSRWSPPTIVVLLVVHWSAVLVHAGNIFCDDKELCSEGMDSQKELLDVSKGLLAELDNSGGSEGTDDLGAFDDDGNDEMGDPSFLGKRQEDPIFMRFGKKQDPFLRFGKRQDPFLRFGKRQDPFLRFGKRQDPFLRFGKRQDPFLRFGKRQDPFLRFGKRQVKDPFLRFGKRQDPFLRFGKRQDPFLRFGKRQDPFLRFGKRQDPFLRFGKRQDPFLRFGKRQDPFLRFGKRQDPFLRFGKRQDPFLRFGKSEQQKNDENVEKVSYTSRHKRSAEMDKDDTMKWGESGDLYGESNGAHSSTGLNQEDENLPFARWNRQDPVFMKFGRR